MKKKKKHTHAARTEHHHKAVWYQMSAEHVLEALEVSRKEGLADAEVSRRKKRYGKNAFPRGKQKSAWSTLGDQFKSPLLFILLIAAGVSAVFSILERKNDFVDAIVIAAAVVLNAAVGFVQERKTQKALQALERVIVTEATVLRGGSPARVPLEELVPGDIVHLEAGDKVPADCRVLHADELAVDESALTGESKPVSKDVHTISEKRIVAERSNMVFLGTVVVAGRAEAVVVATGKKTQMGAIAELVSGEGGREAETPLQRKLRGFSRRLGLLIFGVVAGIFALGLLRWGATVENAVLFFETAVALAVAAIPEGLVVAVTVILAIGMQRILKENALVRRLVATETLGSTTVICTDKTGTLTEGNMRVAQIVTEEKVVENFEHEGDPLMLKEGPEEFVLLLRIGMLCNDAIILNPDEKLEHRVYEGLPTEVALLRAGANVGLRKDEMEKETPRLDTIPFDSRRKFMATLNALPEEKRNVINVKGAPEKVLSFCSMVYTHGSSRKHKSLTPLLKKKIVRQYEHMSREGLRVIAMAYRKVDNSIQAFDDISGGLEQDFVFVGFVGIKDPLRKEVKETIETCKRAGIHVVMITGDHRLTARAIGFELGLPVKPGNVVEGDDLEHMNETELRDRVSEISVYARVSPRDKLRIVKAWQARGDVVAMTGDGVNDAPALKRADIGIALGSGTEVAKETADMVLLDNKFSTIVTAVREGRIIYDNIKKVVFYYLSDSFAEVIVIVVALLLEWPLPLLVAQILYINLVNNSLPALALTQEKIEEGVMEQSPQERDVPLMDGMNKVMVVFLSSLSAAVALALFWWQKEAGDIGGARTIAFTFLAIKSLFYLFSIRSLRRPVWRIRMDNKYIIFAVIVGVSMQVAAVQTPFFQRIFHTRALSMQEWGVVLAACIFTVGMLEVSKWAYAYGSKRRTTHFHRRRAAVRG